METCDLASGRSHPTTPALRSFVSSRPSRCAYIIAVGIISGVSLQAYPNMSPWSPAPCSAVALPSAPRASTPVARHRPGRRCALLRRRLAVGAPRIDALGDVGRLARDQVVDEDLVAMEHIVVVHVADVPHRLAH